MMNTTLSTNAEIDRLDAALQPHRDALNAALDAARAFETTDRAKCQMMACDAFTAYSQASDRIHNEMAQAPRLPDPEPEPCSQEWLEGWLGE